MKKFLIVSAGFFFIAGYMSIASAHGSKGIDFSVRGHGQAKPHISGRSHKGKHLGNRHGFRIHGRSRPYLGKGGSKHRFARQSQLRKRLGQRQGFRRFGPRRFQRFYRFYGPTLGRYNDYEDRAPREESQPVPQHTQATQIYYDANPEPWFLYGKSKEFRQMGLIPPLP